EAALVARAGARLAPLAHALVDDEIGNVLGRNAEVDEHLRRDVNLLLAGGARDPDEPLRDDGVKRRRYEEGLDAHVEEPRYRGRRVVRVEGREDEVPGERRFYRYLGRFVVPYFADEYDVGVLP